MSHIKSRHDIINFIFAPEKTKNAAHEKRLQTERKGKKSEKRSASINFLHKSFAIMNAWASTSVSYARLSWAWLVCVSYARSRAKIVNEALRLERFSAFARALGHLFNKHLFNSKEPKPERSEQSCKL
jgi:hypothetical protein